MRMYELKIAIESGWYFMEQIGQTGLLEIVPQEYQRYKKNIYAEQVETCKELAGKCDQIETICHTLNIPVQQSSGRLEDLDELYTLYLDKQDEQEPSRHTIITTVAEHVNEREKAIKEIYQNYEQLKLKKTQIVEQFHVLNILSKVLPTSDVVLKCAEDENEDNKLETFGFYYMCGTIDTKDAFRLQRYIFRISRENVIFQLYDLDFEGDKLLPEAKSVPRKIYMIIFQAGASPFLKQRIRDVLRTFGNTSIKLPAFYSKIKESSQHLEEEFNSTEDIITHTIEKLQSSLKLFTEIKDNNISYLEECKIRIAKELKIFEELNKFKVEDKILSAWIWVVEENMETLKRKITQIIKSNSNIKAYISEVSYDNLKIIPPTYFKLSDLTRPFQEIVDTYGVPRFQEANPGCITLVSFPYLFGVMFGDIGHGGLLMLFGYMLIKFTDLWKQKGYAIVNYRFLFFALGFFACFCGLIYNDFLGIPWKLFPSCYVRSHKRFERTDPDCTYWLGFDSVWFQSKQEIGLTNSFKMKLSIIIGVIHMVIGILLKGVNNLHFSNYTDFFFEFIPQLLFMLCTFGYMCFAIVVKWLQDWGDGSTAPSIIALFINVGYTPPGSQLYGDDQGIQQTNIQQNLFLIAFICVFIMLIPKPIILWLKSSNSHAATHRKSSNLIEIIEHSNDPNQKLISDDKIEPATSDHYDPNKLPNPHAIVEEEHDISEIFIHQMIETIEFVLGSISNTASYLRLWALSLAHGQLARVFLDMTVLNQLKGGSPIAAVVGFPIFVGATFAVLMCMDLMECFLHTLRLHWVEFQNKFYKGDGYKFRPFEMVSYIQEYLETTRLMIQTAD